MEYIYENRTYDFNKTYINSLINLTMKSRKDIAESMNISTNVLYSKLSGVTKIYMNDAVLFANALEIPVEDIFCPTSIMKKNVLLYIAGKEPYIPYNEYNISKKNINKYMLGREIEVEDIAVLFNLKTVSIYEKIKGRTKITVEEGILLSQLLHTTINDLYCPEKAIK